MWTDKKGTLLFAKKSQFVKMKPESRHLGVGAWNCHGRCLRGETWRQWKEDLWRRGMRELCLWQLTVCLSPWKWKANKSGASPVVCGLAAACLLAISKHWAVETRCYFPLFREGSSIQSVQLALTDWECRCSGLLSVQALCVLPMSWAAIALYSLNWAGLLSPLVTSSSVNSK